MSMVSLWLVIISTLFLWTSSLPNGIQLLERKSLTSKMVHLKALLLVGHSWPFLFTMIICMQYLQTVKVNTGHCISAFGSGNWGGGSFRQIIHLFKEHVAVGYPGHLTLFKCDTGAIAFTLNPLEGLQSILFGSLSVQNACYFTVSGDYMYACQGSINQQVSHQPKEAYTLL